MEYRNIYLHEGGGFRGQCRQIRYTWSVWDGCLVEDGFQDT